jgi:3-methyladenine DNA glycosylase AlkD
MDMPPKSSLITSDQLIKTIRSFCVANGNPAIVKKYSRFFKEGFDAYGLDSKCYDACLAKLNDGLTLKLVLEVSPELLKSGKYEETFFAIIMLKRFYPEFNAKTFKEIEKWPKVGIVNWAHADVFAGDIVAFFLQNEIVPLTSLGPWRQGKSKFQRRISAVVLIKLLKDEKNIGRLLDFVEPLMSDEEREVHQGVGWFLREAWKVEKKKTEDFLTKWKNTAPRLIFQYATEKMSASEKARFKKKK